MNEFSPRNYARRTLRCVALGALAAVCVLPATAWLLDRHERSVRIANLRIREAETLGVGRPPTPENFHPIEAVPRPPVVSGFDVVSAIDATGKVQDNEFVLGTEVNGQARAWPLNVMTGPDREVFNDTLGGLSIAATW